MGRSGETESRVAWRSVHTISENVFHCCQVRRGLLVSLSPVLEPVPDLGQGEASFLGERPFLVGRWILIAQVAVFESVSRALLKAVDCLLAVPYTPGQWVLFPDSILVDGAQRSTAQPLGLSIVGFVPEPLQL